MNGKFSKRIPYHYPEIHFEKPRPNYSIFTKNNASRTNTMPLVYYTATHEVDNFKLNTSNEFLSRIARQVDLDSAADSGYGHSSHGSSGYGKSEYYCPEGIPVETALFALLAAAGLAFGILFMTITMITGGRKKRAASLYDYSKNEAPVLYSVMFSELIWQGMSLFQFFVDCITYLSSM